MWQVSNSRTSPEEVTSLIKKQNLIVAFVDNAIVGSVAINSMNDEITGEFGMLVAEKSYRGLGIGYVPDKTEPFEIMHPEKIHDLATECDFTVWYKSL